MARILKIDINSENIKKVKKIERDEFCAENFGIPKIQKQKKVDIRGFVWENSEQQVIL